MSSVYLPPLDINKYCKDNYPTSIIKNLAVIKLLIYIKDISGLFEHLSEILQYKGSKISSFMCGSKIKKTIDYM